jgi:hypothetical protein
VRNVGYMRNIGHVRNLGFTVPLTTVNVERSFSSLGQVFSENRGAMTVETLEMLLIYYYNKIGY